MRQKRGVKPVYIGILTEQKSAIFSAFPFLFGFQKITSADNQWIKGFKREKNFNFFLFSSEGAPDALRSDSVRLRFPLSEYASEASRARRLCGGIADVRERTATQESVSLTRVSTAFSQKSCQTYLT